MLSRCLSPAQDCFVVLWSERALAMYERLTLRNTMSGQQLCWPGVCTPKNKYTLPLKFCVAHLLESPTVFLVDDTTMQLQTEKNKDGKEEKVTRKITSVINHNDKGRPPWRWMLLQECADEHGTVCVTFNEYEKEAEPEEERPLMDLEDVKTPPTPDQCKWHHHVK